MAVSGFVVVDATHGYFDGSCCNVVNEFSVVADDNYCFRTVDDEVFEPADRFNVEMIGWLIEQQYVWRFQEQFCQLNPHSPSSRKLACRAVEIRAFETETEQRLLYIFLEMSHVDGVEFL